MRGHETQPREASEPMPPRISSSLPFKGRARVGMGFFGVATEPHPPPNLPLEGGGTCGAARKVNTQYPRVFAPHAQVIWSGEVMLGTGVPTLLPWRKK